MSELHGLGNNPPIRPLTGHRAPAARPEVEAPANPIGFGEDAAEVRFSAQAPAAPAPPAESPAPARTPAAPAESRQYQAQYDPATGTIQFAPAGTPAKSEEYEGFLVAGAGPRSASLGTASDSSALDASGPIAMIEDPQVEAQAEFPMLDLNGPSNAQFGLFSLSGRELARP